MISRPPLPELLRRTQKDLASRLEGDPFLQRSFEAALAKVLAGLTHGLYGHQEHIGRQAVPNPDAEDNRLADAVRAGEPFPTGDLRPPAHAGCRCLLVPAPR